MTVDPGAVTAAMRREVPVARARWTRSRMALERFGTLRVRLTVAVAVLSAAGLTAGGALLVHAVETTVVRAIEDQSRAELHIIEGQVAGGVPASTIHLTTSGRLVSFVRPDGSRVTTQWNGAGPPLPSPCSTPGAPSCQRSTVPLPLHPRVFAPPPGNLAFAVEAGGPPPGAPPPGPPPPGAPASSAPAPGTPSPGAVAPGLPLPFAAPPPGLGAGTAFLGAHDGPWSIVEMPLVSPTDGPLHAIAVSPLQDVLRSTQTLQRALVVGVPVLVALLTLAAWWLIGRALRPVRVMTLSAAGIADATATDRLAVPAARDELRELAHTLNGMLDRLAEAARRQREFVSDASHELRSPIAATRAQIEVALAHPERSEPAAVLGGVLAETTRLEVLVADLLALARLDEQPAAPHEELDLDDIVFEDAGRTRAVVVDTRGVTAVKISGDRKSLAHLVRNLLDNAARHAASRVAVSTSVSRDGAVLAVDDDGPGIPDADRARVFERFTRLSSSRSRDDGGAGLGLALVRRVADQHGATVHVTSAPLGGARFEVRFPHEIDPTPQISASLDHLDG